jgi:hypothetical protein
MVFFFSVRNDESMPFLYLTFALECEGHPLPLYSA